MSRPPPPICACPCALSENTHWKKCPLSQERRSTSPALSHVRNPLCVGILAPPPKASPPCSAQCSASPTSFTLSLSSLHNRNRKTGYRCPRGCSKSSQFDKPCPGKVSPAPPTQKALLLRANRVGVALPPRTSSTGRGKDVCGTGW